MSDVNEGSDFGGGNFSEFVSRERDRLRAEREQVFTQQKELQRRLDAINREFAAIEVAINPLSEQVPHLVVVAVLRRLLATR